MLLQQPCGGQSCSESRGMYVPLALWLCLLPAKVVVAVIMVETAGGGSVGSQFDSGGSGDRRSFWLGDC